MTSFQPAGGLSACPGTAPTLGVVIVNYNTYDLTRQCVASLLEHGIAPAGQIVVVDNLSPDGSGPRLRADLEPVRVILSARNGGFGAGINLGMAALSTDLVLVLNPDTRFRRNQVPVIQELFARKPRLGIAGLKLINPDGSLQYSARRFYSLVDIVARRTPLGGLPGVRRRLVDSHLLLGKWSGGPFEADWVMGTGFVVRRLAFDEVGRMDEDYFLYFEEVDLCARMWVNGWTVMALPEVELIHDHQRHSKAGIWSSSGQTHLASMKRFFIKFGVPWLRRPSRTQLAAQYQQWRARSQAVLARERR